MKTYQAPNGSLYALDDAIDPANMVGFPTGCVLLTDAQVFALRAPTLAQAQQTQLTTLYGAYQNAVQQDVSYTSAGLVTKLFQADFGSQDTLSKMIAAYQKTGLVPAGFYWVSSDNTRVPFTFADMQGLAAAMAAQGWTAFQLLQARKTSVMAATTVAQVQAVVW